MRLPDKIVERGLMLLALSSVAILLSITFFILREGAPLVARVGVGNFLSTDWHPTAGRFGFRYFLPDTLANGDYIGIDTVSVENVVVAAVPEPGSLLGLAVGGLILVSKLRRKA